MQTDARVQPKEQAIYAQVTRANGTVEPKRLVSYYNSNPFSPKLLAFKAAQVWRMVSRKVS